jgi:hypothetical protein
MLNLDGGVDELLESNQCINVWARGHIMLNLQTGEARELNCKSWKCPKHRQAWVWRWKKIVSRETAASPVDRLITLTLKSTCTPEQLNAARQYLCRKLRKDYETFEYLSILEFTSKTRLPHLHMLARSLFLPQRKLSNYWREATLHVGISPSPVVYIEAPRNQEAAAVYAISYALDGYNKKQDIPAWWRGRKITYSRKFFSTGTTKAIWMAFLKEEFGPPSGDWVVCEQHKHKAYLPPVSRETLEIDYEKGEFYIDSPPGW